MPDTVDVAILRLIKNGNSMHAIAKHLHISSYTVQRRIHRLARLGLITDPSLPSRYLTSQGDTVAQDLGMEKKFRVFDDEGFK